MAQFVVRHQHDPGACPAANPYLGADLLNHLSRANVRQYGVLIKGEAVVQGEHTLYLILEANDEDQVRRFLQPFARAGTVDVSPASTCARVVAGGGCATPTPALAADVPARDPVEACQEAIDAGLLVHRAHPLNCETALPALVGGVVMPSAHFYVRNHFQIPDLDASTWRLKVGGLVDRPLSLSLQDLQSMPSQSLTVTLECAGNGRSLLSPRVDGEQWRLGAVSTAEWTGVPLVDVLDRAGITSDACELLFRGADSGPVEDGGSSIAFERSLRLDAARDPEVLLAYAMNGEALTAQHGFPLRVIVPGWYAVSSVKWLVDIEVIDKPFSGHYQTDAYYFESNDNGRVTREPVTLQRVRALIIQPTPGADVGCGQVVVRGVAWSGAASIARVDVSIGGGSWQEARLVGERNRYRWQWWELITDVGRTGGTTLRARATDMAGRMQPVEPVWNRLGYGNNAVQTVPITVRNRDAPANA